MDLENNYVHNALIWLYTFITTGLDRQKILRKIVNISLAIIFSICFVCSKNRLIETVLLSTHNVCLVEKLINYFSVTHL